MRLLPSVVAGCALTLTVGACSPDDPPTPTPTTAAPEPANPDATPPPLPDQAAQFTPNGAASFVSYYQSLLSYAGVTGDVDALRDNSDPNCSGCTKYINLYERTYAAGGWFADREWTQQSADISFLSDRSRESLVTAVVNLSGGTHKPSDVAPITRSNPATTTVTFAVIYDDRWRVTQLGLGEPQ